MQLSETLFQNEVDYQMAIQLAKQMESEGIISLQDFTKIDRLYTEKYQPIYREARQN